MKPKNFAPLGNRMLAVLTGLGQRVILLMPLINMRQPKITRRSASVIRTIVGVSKIISLLRPAKEISPHYSQPGHYRQIAGKKGQ
jgi:hypothetical protein